MKEVKIDISSVGFPSQYVSDAEKATEQYGLQIGQASNMSGLEKIQTDPSSIYLTSTQKLNFLPSSDLKNSFSPEDQEITPVITNQYEGNSQIVLNSGRLVLNSNSDSVLISSLMRAFSSSTFIVEQFLIH